MFGKIIDNKLRYAPKEFIEDGKRIIGFTENFLKERGYKKIIFTECPNEYYKPVYIETEENITEHWEEI